MRDFQKEKIALKAYRLAEISDHDWEKVLNRYQNTLREMWLIPNFIWYAMAIIGPILMIGGAVFTDEKLMLIGVIVGFSGYYKIRNRSAMVDGFRYGYEWGKRDGVCVGLGIREQEQSELFRLAHDLIIEFKVETGDPDLELGKRIRKDL
jgi:hypothetical protein